MLRVNREIQQHVFSHSGIDSFTIFIEISGELPLFPALPFAS